MRPAGRRRRVRLLPAHLPRRGGRGQRGRRAGPVTEAAVAHQAAQAATAPTGPPTTTLPLPTTTAPEQLLLTWGADPATAVTVSWSAPGTVAAARAGADLLDPADHRRQPRLAGPGARAAAARRRPGATARPPSVSFTDGLNGQTTYFYHVQLTGLEPGTRYYYQVSDGAAHAVHGGRLVRDRARRAGRVPLLQLRRPGHPVLGPERLGQHLARVLRQRLVRGQRDREPRRRPRRAAVPPAQRRPVLRQPGRR